MIDTCRLSFGGCGIKHAIRAKNVEEFLIGKSLSLSILYNAVDLLTATTTITSEDETSKSAYFSSLAVGFLFQFFNSLIDSPSRITNGYVNGHTHLSSVEASKLEENQKQVNHSKFPTLLSSGKQVLETGSVYYPIGEPVMKSGAPLQASGEAVFVDDIPSPTNCLHGAYIYSAKPLAKIRSIKLRPELQLEGVRDILSSKDIPSGGVNIGAKTAFGSEPLFAEEIARSVGERLAFVQDHLALIPRWSVGKNMVQVNTQHTPNRFRKKKKQLINHQWLLLGIQSHSMSLMKFLCGGAEF